MSRPNSTKKQSHQQAKNSWQPTLNRFFGGKSVPVQTTLTHLVKKLKAGDGAGTIVVAGEENTQPFESIENEAATGKNTTDNPAQTKPVLGPYKPRKSLSLREKKKKKTKSSTPTVSGLSSPYIRSDSVATSVGGDDHEDRQLMAAYGTGTLTPHDTPLTPHDPPLTPHGTLLGDLTEWEESEKKRSKQLSSSMEGMSPLRERKTNSLPAGPKTPIALPTAPSFSPMRSPLLLLCQDFDEAVGSDVSHLLFSPSPSQSSRLYNGSRTEEQITVDQINGSGNQANGSGDQTNGSGDQVDTRKSRKALVFPEVAVSELNGCLAPHGNQNMAVCVLPDPLPFGVSHNGDSNHDQSALFDEILSNSPDCFGDPEGSHVEEVGLNRYLVLESVSQEYTDQEQRSRSEIMLRLYNKERSEERFCYLRDCWVQTAVLPGDIVQVNSQLDPQRGCYVIDNQSPSSFVVNPDHLISGTTISTSTSCLRKAVLSELFKGDACPTEAMAMGTLLHKVFQQALEVTRSSGVHVRVTAEVVSQQVDQVVHQLESLDQFYSLDMSEVVFAEKLLEYVPVIVDWCNRFLHDSPLPGRGEIHFNGDEKSCVCVSEVVDIEENIWSPRYGLKGKVDVTVTLKGIRNGDLVVSKRAPLELKTGKMYHSQGSIEHRAQVMLYSLMLAERYRCPEPSGLLFYIKPGLAQENVKSSGHVQGIPVLPHEIRGLLLQRNSVARYLGNQGGLASLPGMLRNRHTCQRCPRLQQCVLYHSSVERGTAETSGLGDIFDKTVSHLSPAHLHFFEHWLGLALEEHAHTTGKNSRLPWASAEEESNDCVLTNLVAAQAVRGVDRKWCQSFCRSGSAGIEGSSISPNERVIVSLQDGSGWAIATGYVKAVLTSGVEVTIDRPVKADAVCRLDMERTRSVNGLLANLARLFVPDSEREHLLRNLIIDLAPPRFASERVYHNNSSLISFCASEVQPSGGKHEHLHMQWNSLNSDQRAAILKAVSAKDYALILGMPGTGKTTTISCLVQELVTQGRSVLVTGYTHLAVDNILLKLKQVGVDFLRLGSLSQVHPHLHPYTAVELSKGITTVEELKHLYMSKAVVAATCLGTNHAALSKRIFDYCIVDEASQITLLASLGPLFHAKVFILVGDHYQLPPLVQSTHARDGGLGVSLFKRLSEHHPEALVCLVHQYRMNRDIMLLANSLVYNHRLMCGSLDVADSRLVLQNWEQFAVEGSWLHTAICPRQAVVFLNTDQCGADEECTGDRVCNMYEARTVETIATSLVKAGLRADKLGVITPYRYQQNIIRERLAAANGDTTLTDVEVNTVDKYQGRDKSCIIVSFVRSNGRGNVGALIPDWRRINVALTRAEHKLIMIGSVNTLRNAPLMECLLQLLMDNMWLNNMFATSAD